MGSTYVVVVAGPMSSAFSRTVRDRFDCVRVAAGLSYTVVECLIGDQPALRALLTQLWDDGSEVLLVSQILTESPRSHHGQGYL